ncbi:MatB [Escherichia coli TA447]|uniref:MatB n=1 Tax=Escherichia coli TA447 TaxID=656447 RepID=A0A1X3J5L5_ECOLX|nr:MatB [Escherichia coli TA447]
MFTGMGVAQAADVTAQAVATWSATAKKAPPVSWL